MYLNYINYLLIQGKLDLIFLHDLQRTANDMVVESANRIPPALLNKNDDDR
jgi:hypothetical protein